jgi:hypothetical protein
MNEQVADSAQDTGSVQIGGIGVSTRVYNHLEDIAVADAPAWENRRDALNFHAGDKSINLEGPC